MTPRQLCVFYGLRRAQRRGLRHETTPPTCSDVRDVLDELDAPRIIDTAAALEALKPDTVIRDADGYVCERWPAAWMTVALTEPHLPVTPAQILALPEEQQT